MSDLLGDIAGTFLSTIRDVIPIAAVVIGFQLLVLRRPIPHLRRVVIGFIYVLTGLSLFLVGLELALFPLGRLMATQLTDPAFLAPAGAQLSTALHWLNYHWVFLFAFAIGFSTTIAEPSLYAVALKANRISGGAIGIWGLRIAVALGVAVGIALGTYRIVTGLPIHYFIIDSGGVTTSTVTVPLVAALGLGLAETVPGRHPLIDGFGLIAFASLFPIMSVLAYAQISELRGRIGRRRANQSDAP